MNSQYILVSGELWSNNADPDGTEYSPVFCRVYCPNPEKSRKYSLTDYYINKELVCGVHCSLFTLMEYTWTTPPRQYVRLACGNGSYELSGIYW